MRRIVLGVILLLIGISAYGQQYISMQTAKDSMTIGEPFVIVSTIKLDVLPTDGFIDFSPFDTIPNLAYSLDTNYFSQYGDAVILKGGKLKLTSGPRSIPIAKVQFTEQSGSYYFRDSISIAIYDVGQFLIPSPILSTNPPIEILPTRAPSIIVRLPDEVQANIQDSIFVAPIKNIIEEPTTIEDFKYIFIGLGFLLFSILLVYFLKSRKKKPEEKVEEIIFVPAHIIANKKLRALDKKELWQQGNIKGYQSELTFIIREYLENRFRVNALEMTSDEILNEVPEEVNQDQLRQILHIADMVKFAKANPPADIHSRFMDMSFALVEETKMEEEADD